MNIKDNKKMFLYEVDPLFFHDSNDDGFGDFQGFLKKIDYFNYLDIDGIIFPDIFNQEETILKNVNETIYDKYGNINDLKNVILKLEENNKDIFVEISLEKILNSMIIKKKEDTNLINDISHFIQSENQTRRKKLNWNTEKRLEAFKKIINFWTKINIKNFIFVDFEFLYEKNKKLDNKLIEQLKFFYSLTRKISENAMVGIKSLYFDNKTINLIFKKYIGSICDFYIDSSFSLIATEKNHHFDIMKKFNHKVILKKIKKLKINPLFCPKYFISFNNNKIGRVNSRWLNENNLIDESSKSLLLMQNILPFSSINYYGDETGLQRLKIDNRDDYHDYEYVGKKRELEFSKHKINYEESQKFLSRINTQSVFIWNKKTNGGFSNCKNIFRKLPINWFTHNLRDEYLYKESTVNFYKNIVNLCKNSELMNVSNNEKISIKLWNKILTMQFGNRTNKKKIIINLSNKSINKKINKKWNVVLSTFPLKQYHEEIRILCPYESLIIEKKL